MKKRLSSNVVTLLILVVAALSIYFLAELSVSRFHSQRGMDNIKINVLTVAEEELALASHYLPSGVQFFGNDMQRLSVAYGTLYFKKAGVSRDISQLEKNLTLSVNQYEKAVSLNPLDAIAATGLANAITAQQDLFTWMYPGSKNPYNALPLHLRVIKLRPNATVIRYNYVLYLAAQKDEEQLDAAVTKLVSINPRSYRRLSKEKFYTAHLEAVKKGAIEATKSEIIERDAYLTLSDIAYAEDDLINALHYYKQMLAVEDAKNRVSNYIQGARLALLNEDLNQASVYFLRSLEVSQDPDKTIRTIHKVYSDLSRDVSFVGFAKTASDTFNLSNLLEICVARSLQGAGQMELAKAKLKRIDSGKYAGESLYYLAKIYQQEEDWDNMELASQRASVLNPEEARYHKLFLRARKYQHK